MLPFTGARLANVWPSCSTGAFLSRATITPALSRGDVCRQTACLSALTALSPHLPAAQRRAQEARAVQHASFAAKRRVFDVWLDVVEQAREHELLARRHRTIVNRRRIFSAWLALTARGREKAAVQERRANARLRR